MEIFTLWHSWCGVWVGVGVGVWCCGWVWSWAWCWDRCSQLTSDLGEGAAEVTDRLEAARFGSVLDQAALGRKSSVLGTSDGREKIQ